MEKKRLTLIKQFSSITGASQTVAENSLDNASFSLSDAVNLYYSDTSSPAKSKCKQDYQTNEMIGSFYETYASPDTGVMEAEGVEQLSSDLGLDTLDVVWIIISFKCDAKIMGSFTKAEWLRGMTELECSSFQVLRKKIVSIRQTLEDVEEYKKIYEFAFQFALEHSARNLPIETATALWSILLPFLEWNLCNEWLTFIRSEYVTSRRRAVTRDEWNFLLHFQSLSKHGPLTQLDKEESAWPLLIDEFYDTYLTR